MHLGLDLENVEVTGRDEIAAFRSSALEATGGRLTYPVSAYSVMLENRPDMLKLHFRQMNTIAVGAGSGELATLARITMLNWYLFDRYEEGIIAEIRGMHRAGATREQVGEVLAISFMHCGPSGLRFLYSSAFDFLQGYEDPEQPMKFPDGWASDPDALRSGMDLSSRGMTDQDRSALFAWYEETIGEVPRSVQFLARHNPDYLKAWRAKLEGTLRGALPKQVLPYIMIHFNVNRGFREGIREAVLLGRAWGMSKAHVVHAISFATGYMAGLDGLYAVDDAVGDLLDTEWDAPAPNAGS
jgi:hypothetical protein